MVGRGREQKLKMKEETCGHGECNIQVKLQHHEASWIRPAVFDIPCALLLFIACTQSCFGSQLRHQMMQASQCHEGNRNWSKSRHPKENNGIFWHSDLIFYCVHDLTFSPFSNTGTSLFAFSWRACVNLWASEFEQGKGKSAGLKTAALVAIQQSQREEYLIHFLGDSGYLLHFSFAALMESLRAFKEIGGLQDGCLCFLNH